MDLTFTDSETAFRDELRAWFAANAPGEEPTGEDASYAWRRACETAARCPQQTSAPTAARDWPPRGSISCATPTPAGARCPR